MEIEKDVVFSDESYGRLADKHKEIGAALQQEIDKFIDTMLAMVAHEDSGTTSAIAGATAQVIHDFALKMWIQLSGDRLKDILNKLAENSGTFTGAVDEADVYPFDTAPLPDFSKA